MSRLGMTAIAATALVALAACSVPEETDSDGDGVSSMTSEEYAKHVTIKSCEAGQFGDITAKLTIKNASKKQLSYLVTAEAVLKNGDRLAELNAAANNVRPGQTATTDAIGVVEGAKGKDFTCKIVSVETL